MDRRDGRKPADSTKAVEPAMRIVLLAMECSRLRNELDSVSTEKDKLAALANENEVLRARVSVLETSLASKSKIFDNGNTMAAELASLKAELQRKESELRRHQTEKQIIQLSVDDLKAKAAHADSLQLKIEELRTDNTKLNKEALELRLQVDEVVRLKRENSNLHSQLDEIARQKTDNRVDSELLKDYTTRVATLQNDNGHLRSRLQELLDRENEHIHRQETITALEQRLRSLMEELEGSRSLAQRLSLENSKLAADSAKLLQYEDSIRKLIEENDRITSVLSTLRSSSHAEANHELLKANQTLKLQADSLRLELDRTKDELKETTERNRSLSLHCSTKTAEASQLEVVLSENGRLADLLADLKRTSGVLSKEKEDLKTKLTTTEESLRDYQKTAKDQINLLNDQLNTADHKIKQQAIAIENLEKSVAGFGSKSSQLVLAEDNVRKLAGETESLKRVNADLVQFNASLSDQLAQLKHDVSGKLELEASLRAALQESSFLATTKEALELKLKSTSQQLIIAQKQLEDAQSEIYSLTEASKQAIAQRADVEKYRSLYLDAEDKLKVVGELETKIEILQSQNRGLFDTNSELRRALLTREPVEPQAEAIASIETSFRLRSMIQELEVEHTLLKEREANMRSQMNHMTGRLRVLDSLETECNVLRAENLSLKGQKEDLLQEVKRIRNEMAKEKEHQGKCLEDYEDKKFIRMELEATRLRLADSEARLAYSDADKLKTTTELRSKVSELSTQNEQLLDALNEQQVMTGKHKKDLEELRDKVAILEKISSKYDRATAELLEKEDALNDCRRRLEQLENEKVSARQRFEARLNEATSEKESKLFNETSLRMELEEKNAALQKLKDDNLQMKANEARRKLLEDEVTRLQSSLSDTKSKLSAIQATSGDLSQLQLKAKMAEDDNIALRKRISEMVSLMDEMRSLNLDLEVKNKTIPGLQSQVNLLEQQMREKDSSIAELSNQLAVFERNTKQKSEMDKGTEKLLNARISELEALNAKHVSQQQSIGLEIESLRLENNRLKAELVASEELLVEIKKQARENHSLITDHHQLQTQKEHLAMRLAKLEEEATLYKEKLGEALEELERVPLLELDVRRKTLEISDLQFRVNEMMKNSELMRAKLAEREIEISESMAKAEKNRQALADVNISHMQAEIKALENDRNSWKAHAQQLEKALGQQEQEAHRKSQLIIAEKSALARQLQESKNSRQDHEAEVRHLLDEIDSYRKKVDLLQFKLRECYVKIDKFEDMVDQSQLQTSMVSAKFGNSENTLARENKKLLDSLQRTNDELIKLKTIAEQQALELRHKSSEISSLRKKLACHSADLVKDSL